MPMEPQPLVGIERDEITRLVTRIRQADDRRQKPESTIARASTEDIKWAEDMQLPAEFFEYFILDRAA